MKCITDPGFDWNDRNNPCGDAYFSPDKRFQEMSLHQTWVLMAKKGDDNILHVIVNDLLSALPLNEVCS